MKLHDLRPPDGSNTARTRVGRGIAAGKGKTAGRGTKGQKARAGGSIPPWFEGGQTPLHMRIPKLRGFKNRAKIDYEVVNVGDIAARIDAGSFAEAGTAPKGEQLTINADILRAVGLVRNVKKPLKILGNGELASALFVVADAFTKSATTKIEAAGGTVSILEIPTQTRSPLGIGEEGGRTARVPRTAAGRAAAAGEVRARAARTEVASVLAAEVDAATATKAARDASKVDKVDKVEKVEKVAKAEKVDKPSGASAKADKAGAKASKADAKAEPAKGAAEVVPTDAPEAVAVDAADDSASDTGSSVDQPADAADAAADEAGVAESDANDDGAQPADDESA